VATRSVPLSRLSDFRLDQVRHCCNCAEVMYTLVGVLCLGVAWLCYKYLGPGSNARSKPQLPPVQDKGMLMGSGSEIPCRNPADGLLTGTLRSFTPEEVELSCLRAKEAQQSWSKTSFEERRAVLQDMLDFVVKNQDELAHAASLDSGKTLLEAVSGEILPTLEKLRWMIFNAAQYLAPERRSPPLLLFVKEAYVEYIPLGVVGAIVPFNYPVHNVFSAVSSIIFTGNGAVVKVSEHASWSSQYLGKVLRGILAKRGHNPELVHIITGYGETGNALCSSKNINKILFIGSPEVGKLVMAAASKNLTPVILELGGKDPFIVLEDADLDHALDNALRGIYFNQGQNCLAAERFYIHADVYDAFVTSIAARVNSLRQGNSFNEPCDVGCLTNKAQVNKLLAMIQDAKSKGASVLAGGDINPRLNGTLMPTVIAHANHSMDIVNEEAFGPIMTIIKFSNDEDLLKMVNSTRYALGMSIYSKDYSRAKRLASCIDAGMVTINDFGLSYLIQALPFGGVKDSGFGKFNGPEGLRAFCLQRTVVSDRFGMLAKTPSFLQYPVPVVSKDLMVLILQLIYQVDLTKRLGTVVQMCKLLMSGDRKVRPIETEKLKAA